MHRCSIFGAGVHLVPLRFIDRTGWSRRCRLSVGTQVEICICKCAWLCPSWAIVHANRWLNRQLPNLLRQMELGTFRNHGTPECKQAAFTTWWKPTGAQGYLGRPGLQLHTGFKLCPLLTWVRKVRIRSLSVNGKEVYFSHFSTYWIYSR